MTQGLIFTSNFARLHVLTILGGTAGIFIVWHLLLRNLRFRWQWDRLLLSIPVLGTFNRTLNAARLARTLSILVKSGVPLLEALNIGTRMIKRLPLKQSLTDAAVRVSEGGRLHDALQKTGYFPPLLLHMISAGEDSGELENMLERAASNQEREMQTKLTAVTSLLEPVMILIMGAVVLVIVLAILLPIFEMNQMVGA